MTAVYSSDSKTLTITPKEGETLKFNEFQAIHYSAEGELNLCSSDSYQYQIVDGVIPNLTIS